jgi:hypothetical protein
MNRSIVPVYLDVAGATRLDVATDHAGRQRESRAPSTRLRRLTCPWAAGPA